MSCKIPPMWDHQKEAVDRDIRALLFDCGTGKTRTVIEALKKRMNAEKRYLRTLIFCPPIVVNNWKTEWLKYSKVDSKKVVPLLGSGKKRYKIFTESAFTESQGLGLIPTPGIYVTNYEALRMGELYEAFKQWKPEVIIWDESHKLKNFKSGRSKLAVELSNPHWRGGVQPTKYLLSGTFILNTPMDVFNQFLVLDGGDTFGSNYFAFRARYFVDHNAGMPRQRYFPNWQPKTKERDGLDTIAEINRLIGPRTMVVKKEDCLDLPPLVRQIRAVTMTKEQAKIYKSMKNDFVAFIEGKTANATLAITKGLRLMQIASGFIKTVDEEEIEIDGNPKEKALEEMLEELTPGSKVLVWAAFKANYATIRRVCERLGVAYVEVHGGITANQKFKNVEQFNSDEKCRVLIGHPGSGGIGINLVAASYSIFYSRNFSLEADLQAEARNYRGGSQIHERITRIDLITEETIDELVMKKLAEKLEVGNKILKDISLEL